MVEALARPPTPPRTTTTTTTAGPATSCMLSTDEKDRIAEETPAILQTPGASPFSTNGSTGHPSTRQSKRVNFSPWTRYIKPPAFSNAQVNSNPELKSLPPSNECKPSKSILKATLADAPVTIVNDNPLTPESFTMLLESVAQQLAGESTTSRLDAYMHFFGALKAYEGVPDPHEISGKLGLITQFIQRDVSRNLENAGPVDINLVTQALKLSNALLYHIETAPQLSDEFKIFLIDHSINCLQDAKVPKMILTHYMSILSTQEFGPKIMTNARFTRLLAALHTLTDKVNGNGIVSYRLSIYQRVLGQSKATFFMQAPLWMEHLISGLLHTMKDTRYKAITLGFQTSMLAGPNPTLSKTLREIFDRPLDDDRKLVNEICERMSRMMASSESGIHVPQVWSVIILLLRSKKLNIDQWSHFREWVLVLQRCFNCSDTAIKAQAIMGWNRFVFVIRPNETTNLSMMKMLSKPILSQFERKKQDKNGAQPSQLALSSYYNLLYYAFHPSASFAFLDTIWKEYIAAPSSNIFSSNSTMSDRVSGALSNMLWSSRAKVWTEAKVSESNRLDPAELPTLDCNWTRSRITSVLGVFKDLFKSSVWVDGAIGQSNIAIAWSSLSSALSFASSKEITPTPESMQAVASVLGFLQHLWKSGPSSLNAAGDNSMDKFFDRFHFLSTTIIVSLGSIPFTEKYLLKTADAEFQPATPTHRDQQANTSLDAPILHFLRFISDVSDVSEPTPSYLRLINDTLKSACNGKISRGSRLELLRQCADLYPNGAEFQVIGSHTFARIAWKSTAQLTADTLCSFPMESARERDGTVSRDYENIVKILSAGLKFSDVSEAWNQLLDAAVRVVRTERGDRAISTMVLEPLAEQVTKLNVQETYLPSVSLLDHSLSISYHSSDANGLFLPEKLLALVHKTLLESYTTFDQANSKDISGLIESTTSFLGSGALAFRSSVLEKLQEPLARWLKDEKHQLNVESGVDSRVLTACRALSSAILNILQGSIPENPSSLPKTESIICAGLESCHVSVAKRFVDLLNGLSESNGPLSFGASVTQALQKAEPKIPSDGPQVQPSAEITEDNSVPLTKGSNRRKTRRSAGLASSPVVKAKDEPMVSSEEQSQVEVQEPSGVESTDEPSFVPEALPLPADADRNRIFSMIEGLRSSSPVNTPQQLEFRTPPHMRHLPRGARDAEPPLTPTLAAVSAENDDIFLGSSPTPGTRTKPKAAAPRPSSQKGKKTNTLTAEDPPSSPPTVRSPSPSVDQGLEAPSQHNASENGPEASTPVEKRLPKRQTRSASKRSTPKADHPEDTTANPAPQETQDEAAQVESNKSNTNSRRKAPVSKTPPKSKQTQIEKVNEAPVTHNADNDTPDLSDVESQIATQLEQDLEFAVDHNVNLDASIEQIEPAASQSSSKKRKRDVEDVQTPPRQDKRRSTRLSSSQQPAMDSSPAVDMTPEPRSTRSRKTRASQASQDVPAPNPSPAQTSAKKRKSQPKVDEQEPESTESQQTETQPVSEIDETQPAEQDVGAGLEIPEPSQERRRSSRRTRQSSSAISETQSPMPKKSPRASRSRKQEAAQETSQEASKPEDQIPAPQAQQQSDAADVVAEAASQDNASESEIPQHALDTEDDVQMDQSDEQAQQAPTETDIEMDDAEAPLVAVAEPEPEATTEPEPEVDGEEQTMSQTTQTEQPASTSDTEIIRTFEQTLDSLKTAVFDENKFREVDELLFRIRIEAQDAYRRHCANTNTSEPSTS